MHCLSRKTLATRIKDEMKDMVEDIKKQLADVSYLCTTADIWSSFRRSFLGVTVHWIDKHTFTRKSAAIACRRFEGTHNYLVIAKLLTDIHEKYGLTSDKIMCTITDNESNFKKAFKEFNIELEEDEVQDEDDEDYTEEEKTVEFVDMSDDFVHSNEDKVYYLPKRYSCASHTLSLLATTDVNNCRQSIVWKTSQISI